MEVQTHELKVLHDYYEAIIEGRKVSELRKNDRDFQVGDLIILKEWDGENYSGRQIKGRIINVLRDSEVEGLKEGYVVLDIIYSEEYRNYSELYEEISTQILNAMEYKDKYGLIDSQYDYLINKIKELIGGY